MCCELNRVSSGNCTKTSVSRRVTSPPVLHEASTVHFSILSGFSGSVCAASQARGASHAPCAQP
jgi:hypothetical protein